MLPLLFAALQPLTAPADQGLFAAAGLYLVRVTAVEVPNDPKLLGDTRLRVDEVLIGPKELKGVAATYKFFTPSSELHALGGPHYSGKYPDFARPTARGQSRYWWAAPDGKGGWKTANFQKVGRYLPPPGPEWLLQAGLAAGSKEARRQQDLVEALLRLESKRTRIEQIAVLHELERSDNLAVSSAAERILKNLFNPPKGLPRPPEKK